MKQTKSTRTGDFMAGNVSSKIRITYEGFERFDVIIRRQELTAPAAGQLTWESALESGFGKSAFVRPVASEGEQAAKSGMIFHSGEQCLAGTPAPHSKKNPGSTSKENRHATIHAH
jgi:hypothetical protein